MNRQRVTCRCGRPLLYVLGEGAGETCRVQVDCERCRYLLWRHLKARGEVLAKRAVMVVHTLVLPAGVILESIALTLDGGTPESGRFMRQRPASDLQTALDSASV